MINFIVGFITAIVVVTFVPEVLDQVQALTHDAASSVADATDKPITDKILDKIK
jgi:hypothetical protein